VLIAGRGPFVLLESNGFLMPGMTDASMMGMRSLEEQNIGKDDAVLELPTLHVHGLLDEGLEFHRRLLERCEKSSTRLVEWEGGHRVPIAKEPVDMIVEGILVMARETGVFKL